MKKRYGFEVDIRTVLMKFGKTECVVILTIIIVISVKHIMPDFSYIVSFLIYGIMSVLVYSGGILIFHKKEILGRLREE